MHRFSPRNRRPFTGLALILPLLFLTACPKNNPTPTPAPIQVANSMNALAQTVDAATTALISARDAGKISQTDVTIAFKVITAIATTGKQVDSELRTTEGWEVQKPKILKIIASSGLAEISKQLPPNARIIMAAVLTTFNTISSSVGGPTL